MKQRTKETGTQNNDWETPEYIYTFIQNFFGISKTKLYDPCPLHANFNGLTKEWGQYNYINPPYTRKEKEAFILKAYEEFQKGKECIMLIPATTETKIFHNIIVPNCEIYFLYQRVRFKGINTKGEYVENKTGQSGSMIIRFSKTPCMKPMKIETFI